MVELKTVAASEIDLSGQLKGEIGICVVKGAINACGSRVAAGNILVSKEEDVCKLSLEEDSHLLFFGGEVLPEKRRIYWNFVALEEETIEEVKAKWQAWDWPKVPKDETYVPLSGSK